MRMKLMTLVKQIEKTFTGCFIAAAEFLVIQLSLKKLDYMYILIYFNSFELKRFSFDEVR